MPGGNNPYGAPQIPAGLAPPDAATGVSKSFPTYVLVVAIISLLLCLLRGVMFLFSLVGMQMLPADHPLGHTVLFEVLTGGGIFLFGVIGYGLILAKKPLGSLFAWLEIAAAVGNMIVGLVQAPITFEMQNMQGPTLTAAWGGVVVVILIRFALLAMAAVAIVQFQKWVRETRDLPETF